MWRNVEAPTVVHEKNETRSGPNKHENNPHKHARPVLNPFRSGVGGGAVVEQIGRVGEIHFNE